MSETAATTNGGVSIISPSLRFLYYYRIISRSHPVCGVYYQSPGLDWLARDWGSCVGGFGGLGDWTKWDANVLGDFHMSASGIRKRQQSGHQRHSNELSNPRRPPKRAHRRFNSFSRRVSSSILSSGWGRSSNGFLLSRSQTIGRRLEISPSHIALRSLRIPSTTKRNTSEVISQHRRVAE